MNNTQLDMVLEYLNEGTEIDSTQYMIESIDEMVENCFYESTMITSLLEADEEDSSEKKEIGLGTKIIEGIKRFINWVKSLIAKLKNQIAKLAVKSLVPKIKSNVDNQLKQLANVDNNTEIKLSKFESFVLYENEIFHSMYIGNSMVVKRFKEEFSKTPKFMILMVPRLASVWNVRVIKAPTDKITVGEYKNKAPQITNHASTCYSILESAMSIYNDAIKEANALYKDDPKEANNMLKEATKVMNDTTSISSGAIKAILTMYKLTSRKIGKLEKESNNKE